MAKKNKKLPADVEEAMLTILEYAMKRPADWRTIGRDPVYKAAVDELKRKGVVEVWPETGLYRIVKA
jgi:hypothetical protein